MKTLEDSRDRGERRGDEGQDKVILQVDISSLKGLWTICHCPLPMRQTFFSRRAGSPRRRWQSMKEESSLDGLGVPSPLEIQSAFKT